MQAGKLRRSGDVEWAGVPLLHIASPMEMSVPEHRLLPPAAIVDESRRPLLGWRVALLPYLEQRALYDKFRLNEPWDSKHNMQLLAQMPEALKHPLVNDPAATVYLAPRGEGTFWEDGKSKLSFAQILDGTSNTIMVVEAAELVPWTKPEDLPYVPDQALPRVGGQFQGHFFALFADGVVRTVPSDADRDLLEVAAVLGAESDVRRLAAVAGATARPYTRRGRRAQREGDMRDKRVAGGLALVFGMTAWFVAHGQDPAAPDSLRQYGLGLGLLTPGLGTV